jgi:hypothetical protein
MNSKALLCLSVCLSVVAKSKPEYGSETEKVVHRCFWKQPSTCDVREWWERALLLVPRTDSETHGPPMGLRPHFLQQYLA